MSARCVRTRKAHEDGACGFDEVCPRVFEMLACHEIPEYQRVASEVRAQLGRARRLGVKAPFETDGETEEVDPNEQLVNRRLTRGAFW